MVLSSDLKQTLQIATRQQTPWETAVGDLLTSYRATPYATTGKSPSELLHNRRMTTTLNIRPTEVRKQQPADVCQRVERAQNAYQQYADSKRGAVQPLFDKGDYVRVKNP